MVYQYQWRVNKYPVTADTAAKEISRIESRDGSVTPKSLLEESRAEDSTLHKCFEWDDSKAAEKYRLRQSGEIIRNIVRVEVKEDPEEKSAPKTVRAFVDVERDYNTQGKFVAISTARQDETLYNNVLHHAYCEMRVFREKYKSLKEVSAVIEAIDKALLEERK